MEKPEKRAITQTPEISSTEGGIVLAGYASVYGALSLDLGGKTETVAPGAFDRALAENDIRALWSHDERAVLGRTKSNTLKLSSDDRGLWAEVLMPRSAIGEQVAESVRRGDVDGMSIAFYVRQDDWSYPGGKARRTLLDVDLIEVSFVTFPAYPDTSAMLRSYENWHARQEPVSKVYLNLRSRMLQLLGKAQ